VLQYTMNVKMVRQLVEQVAPHTLLLPVLREEASPNMLGWRENKVTCTDSTYYSPETSATRCTNTKVSVIYLSRYISALLAGGRL
jgi:hypothetical protein